MVGVPRGTCEGSGLSSADVCGFAKRLFFIPSYAGQGKLRGLVSGLEKRGVLVELPLPSMVDLKGGESEA